MIFVVTFVAAVTLVSAIILINWWRDEQQKLGKRVAVVTPSDRPIGTLGTLTVSTGPTSPTPHPSIDPYLAELRQYLLTPPLPAGPGEMANRVYEHLTRWVNEHLNEDAFNTTDTYDLEQDLLVDSPQRFIDISRQESVSSEDLTKGTE
jgi:hypothetical protein